MRQHPANLILAVLSCNVSSPSHFLRCLQRLPQGESAAVVQPASMFPRQIFPSSCYSSTFQWGMLRMDHNLLGRQSTELWALRCACLQACCQPVILWSLRVGTGKDAKASGSKQTKSCQQAAQFWFYDLKREFHLGKERKGNPEHSKLQNPGSNFGEFSKHLPRDSSLVLVVGLVHIPRTSQQSREGGWGRGERGELHT